MLAFYFACLLAEVQGLKDSGDSFKQQESRGGGGGSKKKKNHPADAAALPKMALSKPNTETAPSS